MGCTLVGFVAKVLGSKPGVGSKSWPPFGHLRNASRTLLK